MNECIITARFSTWLAKFTVVQVYAPTETSSDEDKESFYNQLQDVLDSLPSFDIKLVMGDFNAKLDGDRRGMEATIGPQSAPRKAPVSDLYENFNTLNIPDRHNFQLLVLIHKFFYHKEKLPVIFTSYFNANFLFHNYDTHNRDNLHLARCKTSYGLKCIKYKGSNLWNKLPSELKLITSINSFKCKLKNYVRALS